MKFGKTYVNHQIPDWSDAYIDYKNLKNIIRQIVILKGDDPDNLSSKNDLNSEYNKFISKFFIILEQDLDDVDALSLKKFNEYSGRLRRIFNNATIKILYTHRIEPVYKNDLDTDMPYSFDSKIDHHFIDTDELDEILAMLLELKSSFRNLKFYNDLNDRAVKKILKKFDKKCATMERINFYENKVMAMEFVHINKDIEDSLEMTNTLIEIVYDYISQFSAEPLKLTLNQNGSEEDLTSRKHSDLLTELIEKDDAEGLINELIYTYRSIVLIPSKTLINLLNKAAILQCFKCIDRLLKIIPSLADSSDLNKRNFFHHHVIALGKNHENNGDNRNSSNNTTSLLTPINSSTSNKGSIFKSTFDSAADQHYIEPFKPMDSYLVDSNGPDGINSMDKPSSLSYIISKLPPHLRSSLLKRDSYLRTPLHYAAQYGLVETTKIIIQALRDWDAWDSSVSIDDVKTWADKDGVTPLHLAVLGHHPNTIKTLWSFVNENVVCQNPKLLHIAVNLNDPSLINALLKIKGININYSNSEKNNETAIYIAAKLNLIDAAECLLNYPTINAELKESMYGFTPLFIAAIEGFKDMVKLLIGKGKANIRALDDSGFAPVEHAALRGFLDIAELLKIDDDFSITNPIITEELRSQSPFGKQSHNNSSASLSNSILNGKNFYRKKLSDNNNNNAGSYSSNSSNKDLNTGTDLAENKSIVSNINPVELLNSNDSLKTDESFLSITLGSNDTSIPVQGIKLNKIPFSKLASTELDTALSLSISCNAAKEKSPILIDLPVDESSNAINFKLDYNKDMEYIIYFDLVPTHQRTKNDFNNVNNINSNSPTSQQLQQQTSPTQSKKILGRAVALLDSAKTRVGKNRRSLEDTITIPIISSSATMEIIGSLTLEVLIIQPFHPTTAASTTKNRLTNDSYWKKLVTTRIVGHRGSGKNIKKNSLQLGENTMESFIAASSLGASYVEFDVQLTKDHVPVIYHDFLVAESGVDIPMHELTLEQFLHMSEDYKKEHHADEVQFSDLKKSSSNLSLSSGNKANKKASRDDFDLKKHFYSSEEERKMGLTKTYKQLNFKGNSRGSSIASNFVTLKEVLTKLPENVGFNIECKYPMPDEATKEEMGQIAVEMNFWVDTVLEVVFKYCKDRDIIFSSFHPDICMMLSLKQPHFPILFLTEGGASEMFDYRCLSLKNAINFAKKWNLLGIVTAAKPIVMAPRLAQVVKSSGLVLFTYGVQNNDPDIAKKELRAGVDAVIVDNVLAIRKELTKDYFKEVDEKYDNLS
ncbi:GDPD-domain-containing protein [Hanseniaspora valbyensis NRRL Y-1626]|uniref:GDPD-domain-containing protein n=1 Tax=Hanseniaspora valbyensis NRRL Y-1626 TaxID=766949 RepID=A0A1B7TH22_9ASCO|nr:GDPD-domain-containing protein [Hanseniaspora valbyensis NRRL Y-1626]